MTRLLRPAFTLTSLALLAGCSLFHSNIRSGFACGAPTGTCAPSTTIDDAALREIDVPGAAGAAETTGPAEESGPKAADRVFVAGAHPALRVIYPAWRDGDGRMHPRTVAYAPVEMPRATTSGANAMAEPIMPHRPAGLLTIAEAAPEVGTSISHMADTGSLVPTVQLSSRPLATIQSQVHDILANAPKPLPMHPAPASDAATAGPIGGPTFPPAGH